MLQPHYYVTNSIVSASINFSAVVGLLPAFTRIIMSSTFMTVSSTILSWLEVVKLPC